MYGSVSILGRETRSLGALKSRFRVAWTSFIRDQPGVEMKSHVVLCSILALSSLAGCGSMDPQLVAPNVMPASKANLCNASGKEYSDILLPNVSKGDSLSITKFSSRIDNVRKSLPANLQNDAVVNTLLSVLQQTPAQSQRAVTTLLMTSQNAPSEDVGAVSVDVGSQSALGPADFRNFATNVRDDVQGGPLSIGVINTAANVSPSDDSTEKPFSNMFVDYYVAYYKGQFVDRFGNVLSAPQISLTVSDAEIAGAFSVLVELLADYVLRTPIWQDHTTKVYYPGTFGKSGSTNAEPTVLSTASGYADVLPLLPPNQSQQCGITALKADAVEYLAKTAGNRASLLGGLVGGSWGGYEVGLGFAGKFSVGDNKTLSTLVSAVLQTTFERATEDAAYRVLTYVTYNQKVGDVAGVISSALTPPSGAGK